MSDRSTASSRALVSLAIALVAIATIAPPTLAGIGNPLKKAKEKAEQTVNPKEEAKAKDQPCKDTVVFDDVTLELTDARVSRIVAAFQAASTAGAGRPALVEKLNRLQEERGEIWQKHAEAIMDLQRKRGDVESCIHDGLQDATERRGQEYKNKALSDPVLLQKYSDAAQKYGAAAAQGDTTAQRVMNDILASELAPTREDTVAVKRKCGPIPSESKEEARVNQLDREIAATNEEIRKIDDRIAKEQAKALQMNPQQFATALERIRGYRGQPASKSKSSGSGSKSGDSRSGSNDSGDGGSGSSGSEASSGPPSQCGYTEVELIALQKHIEELRPFLQ
jgi:uncharacterized membrane protein YgcG